MNNQLQATWEQYVSSWKAQSLADKKAIFENCLAPSCQYTDPLGKTKGWDELSQYMLNFHAQVPNAYFVTTYFLSHNHKGIAKWEMTNDEGVILGDGVSYGEYNDEGKLTAITGFYETP